jgi:hypothetical protein
MTSNAERKHFLLIRAALILLAALIVIYIPLKIYIERSGGSDDSPVGTGTISIFATNELNGYREPCG